MRTEKLSPSSLKINVDRLSSVELFDAAGKKIKLTTGELRKQLSDLGFSGVLAEGEMPQTQEPERLSVQIQRLEEKLVKYQKMAVMGVMMSEIVHELNNQLTVLSGRIQIYNLQNEGEGGNELEQMIASASSILNNLLDFVKNKEVKTEIFVFNEWFSKNKALLRIPINDRHKFNCVNQIKDENVQIKISKELLLQVFLNLFNNANQAMSDPGELNLTLGKCGLPVSNDYKVDSSLEFLKISIQDTGIGIPSELIKEIFKPQVSTKQNLETSGSGLGLGISRRIIEHAGGRIVAKNRENERGAVFEIFLPIQKREK